MIEVNSAPGPFGAALDAAARDAGGWSKTQMVYGVEVIGEGDDPQILLTGSEARWMPRAKRWSFNGFTPVKAVIRLSEYRAALQERDAIAAATGEV